MKRIIFFSLSLLIITPAFAQKGKNIETKPDTMASKMKSDPELGMYERALNYADYDAAKNAMMMLVVKHPDNISYLDSLVRLYYSMRANVQCIISGMEYLEKDSSNKEIMEMVAITNSAMKRNKEALDLYEKLYKSTGKVYYLYQIAVNQYVLKRIGECDGTIEAIVKNPASEKEKISITGDEDESQSVTLKAAAYNLKGVIEKELNQPEKAKVSFQAAIAASPDFKLAISNLDALNSKKEETPANDPKPKPPLKKKTGRN